jgi:hypothetical protein
MGLDHFSQDKKCLIQQPVTAVVPECAQVGHATEKSALNFAEQGQKNRSN